jgi:hypothetical protein
MDHNPALVVSASEVAQSFLNTARDQVRAAQSQQWTTVFELADFREMLLKRLAVVTAGPLNKRERDELASAIVEVQALDAEIMRCAEDESQRIVGELGSVEQGRTVAHGYGWAHAPRQNALINRYG